MIRVQNIYYMLSYAYRVLNEDSYAMLDIEKFEYASDLFAAILNKGISNQIRRGMGKEYIANTDMLRSPVGKINVSSSVKNRTIQKKQLVCEFDEFSENAYINRILKSTIIQLIRCSDVTLDQKRALKRILLYFSNVDVIEPHKILWSGIKYHKNNATYKMLINVCYLVIKGMLQSENDGLYKLSRYVDDQRMHRLYEHFILEYYKKHYPQFSISAGIINWNVDDGVSELLPLMKTDIMIEYKGKTVIIDAKYYQQMLQSNDLFNSHTIRSGNLYQIYAYVKNYDISSSGNVTGVLLYAQTNEEIMLDKEYNIGGNRISIKSLNLNTDFLQICSQLDLLVQRFLLD
ncbi:MAG: 5-methylcytosine-specific restriction endonuclease system specificity protein McrC [Acidaminobacter sp.]|uniref:5-methylcytosine-specific restriction endonuclease system specificity protein McrC n=1 Tax=Acidaminobacter sp. TaxID=1872102 RepID=UPI001381B806|nr:5-methylcytosine-specific restriction endonuclease system specificity protein McrC [Acidaminobacter sp.]MZQ97673.1 5-methylcytosine-specific restriction endonuclease system specificity protein McrC [Acidaminobacter sp.]